MSYQITLTKPQARHLLYHAYHEWSGTQYWKLENELRAQGLFNGKDARRATPLLPNDAYQTDGQLKPWLRGEK